MTEEATGSGLAVVGEGDKEAESYEHAEERRLILSLRDKADDAIWDLAVALVDIYDGDKYRAWGYDSWREYVERELDWHIRKAQVMVQLQKWFKEIPANIQTWIKSLGWGKAKILQRVVTTENAAEWRARIEGKTLAEIEEMIKEERESGGEGGTGGGESEPDVARSMSFKLFPDQYKNVEMALEKAKDLAESDKPGHCLDLIATEFLSTHAGMVKLKDYLANVEKVVGVRIVAYDQTADEIRYGSDLLDELDRMAAEAAGEAPDEDDGDDEDESEPEAEA
jgi:hypothetical protein